MTYGRTVCNKLKEIRQEIADKNNIEYATSECHFHGECQGTCPKCEAELRYIENELNKRKHLGKVATIAGISFGIAATFSACLAGEPPPPPPPTEGLPPVEIPLEGDPVPPIVGELEGEIPYQGEDFAKSALFMDHIKTEGN